MLEDMAEPASDILLRPEIELRSRLYGNERFAAPTASTCLDLLAIYPDGKTEHKANMNGADFARYCESDVRLRCYPLA